MEDAVDEIAAADDFRGGLASATAAAQTGAASADVAQGAFEASGAPVLEAEKLAAKSQNVFLEEWVCIAA